jgi:hypothetical protein
LPYTMLTCIRLDFYGKLCRSVLCLNAWSLFTCISKLRRWYKYIVSQNRGCGSYCLLKFVLCTNSRCSSLHRNLLSVCCSLYLQASLLASSTTSTSILSDACQGHCFGALTRGPLLYRVSGAPSTLTLSSSTESMDQQCESPRTTSLILQGRSGKTCGQPAKGPNSTKPIADSLESMG